MLSSKKAMKQGMTGAVTIEKKNEHQTSHLCQLVLLSPEVGQHQDKSGCHSPHNKKSTQKKTTENQRGQESEKTGNGGKPLFK